MFCLFFPLAKTMRPVIVYCESDYFEDIMQELLKLTLFTAVSLGGCYIDSMFIKWCEYVVICLVKV